MNVVRRLRGIATIAVTWALGWAGVATPIFFLLLPNLRLGARVTASLHMARYAGLGGAVTGATMAILVAIFERRATFASLRPHRIALWGAVSGAGYATSLMLLSSQVESFGLVTTAGTVGAVLGGASALLALLVAREADRRTNHDNTSDLGCGASEPPALGTGAIDAVARPPQVRVEDFGPRLSFAAVT